MGTILLINNGISPMIKEKPKLKQFLISIFENEGVDFKSVSYIFCKDDYLLKLNQQYLNHDTLTDILTFTLSGKTTAIIAEIYISVEMVKENANSLGNIYHQELFRVMIHGILHLCGFSDHTSRQKLLMREREDYYLSQNCST
ncbi:MAG: rRNA maturation RNase YbeY [Ginsengibacter sp.]